MMSNRQTLDEIRARFAEAGKLVEIIRADVRRCDNDFDAMFASARFVKQAASNGVR